MKRSETSLRGGVTFVASLWCRSLKEYESLLSVGTMPRFAGWLLICFLSVAVSLLVNLSVSMRVPVFTLPVWTAVAFIVLAKGVRLFDCNCFQGECQTNPATLSFRFAFLVFVLYAVLLYVNGYSVSSDVEGQWIQAQQGKFYDWHPVLHSLFFWLVQTVWDNKIFACIVQIALFSLSVAWLESTLRKYATLGWIRMLVVALAGFSPIMLSLGMRTLMKDALFAVAVVSLMTAVLRIFWSEGQWLEAWPHKILFAFLVLCASFLRHNGIFMTIPLLLLLCFMKKKEARMNYLLTFFLSLAFSLGYFCGRNALIRLGVVGNSEGQKYVEAIGVPIAIIGDVMTCAPDSLDADTRRFCERLCPLEVWKMHYRGDGNSIKRYLDFEYLRREVPPRDFFKYLCRIVKSSPKDAYKAVKRITSIAWNPFPLEKFWRTPPAGNILRTSDFFGVCDLILHPPLGWVLGAPGFAMLMLLISGVVSLLKFGVARAAPHVALCAYIVGTGALMYDNGISDFRFFWAVELAYPIVLLSSFKRG